MKKNLDTKLLLTMIEDAASIVGFPLTKCLFEHQFTIEDMVDEEGGISSAGYAKLNKDLLWNLRNSTLRLLEAMELGDVPRELFDTEVKDDGFSGVSMLMDITERSEE